MPAIDHAVLLGAGVRAFSSDNTVDFFKGQPAAADFSLTEAQRAWLNEHSFPADKIIFPLQVHGATVWSVTERDVPARGIFEADAIVTNIPGLPIAVRTADCAPILVYSKAKRVIAAIHAGWKSTQLHVVMKALDRMVYDHDVDPQELKAIVGPCISRESCQVGPEFKKIFPLDVIPHEKGQCFDIVSANIRQLLTVGIAKENIYDCAQDTYTDSGLHSFRRDGDKSGRMIHVIMLIA